MSGDKEREGWGRGAVLVGWDLDGGAGYGGIRVRPGDGGVGRLKSGCDYRTI